MRYAVDQNISSSNARRGTVHYSASVDDDGRARPSQGHVADQVSDEMATEFASGSTSADCRRTKLAFDDDFMEAECVDDGLLRQVAQHLQL